MVNASDAEIRQRDGDRCARDGSTRDLHIHHRWMRSAGSDERACNRVTLCASCHRWVHLHPADAMEQEWLVSRAADPAEARITQHLWPGVQILLTDECAGVQICAE